jgi:hypothetical protein
MGHAGYAAQPAYARVVELLVPSFGFAWLYLRYGLWPGVILHTLYDVVWMALPLLSSNADGAIADQTLLVAIALAPVWALLVAALRRPPEGDLGRRDTRDAAEIPAHTAHEPAAGPTRAWTPRATQAVLVAGAVGVILWANVTRFDTDAPQLTLTRAEAVEIARTELGAHGVELDASWRELVRTYSGVSAAGRFVWQHDRDAYHRLLGSHLQPPRWVIRRARFEGDVAQRAADLR